MVRPLPLTYYILIRIATFVAFAFRLLVGHVEIMQFSNHKSNEDSVRQVKLHSRHTLQFYGVPPRAKLQLAEFEQYAFDRLQGMGSFVVSIEYFYTYERSEVLKS